MDKILGRKIEMTQIFEEDGTVIPVTRVIVETGYDELQKGAVVDVIGTSKGKGFAGGVKRWGFAGGPRTHGQSDRERAIGSIGGGTFPGRVFKGKKMAGHFGSARITVKNLQVIRADPERNVLLIKGAVPGARNGLLRIRTAKTASQKASKEKAGAPGK